MPPQYLKPHKVCEMLGISRRQLTRLVNRKKIRAFRFGYRTLGFLQGDLETFERKAATF